MESTFYDADLSLIGRTAFHGYQYSGEIIFPSYKGYYDTSIREFLEHTGYLLHKVPNLITQLSSTTKLLHLRVHIYSLSLIQKFVTTFSKQLIKPTKSITPMYSGSNNTLNKEKQPRTLKTLLVQTTCH